jgi:hypothetical protein
MQRRSFQADGAPVVGAARTRPLFVMAGAPRMLGAFLSDFVFFVLASGGAVSEGPGRRDP